MTIKDAASLSLLVVWIEGKTIKREDLEEERAVTAAGVMGEEEGEPGGW